MEAIIGMNSWSWLRRILGKAGPEPEAAGGGAVPPVPVPVELGAPESLPPLALAYLGDAVYELYVRDRVLRITGRRRPGQMHRTATGYVRAKAQSDALRALLPELLDVEADVVRRGRNAKTVHTRKHAEPADYALATAFEALIGFLYLSGQDERLAYILGRAVQIIDPT